MSYFQIAKIALLVQVMVMGKLAKERDKMFIKQLSELPDDTPLDFYTSNHLNAVYLDNYKMIRQLEWQQI